MDWEKILEGYVTRCAIVGRLIAHHMTHRETVAEHQWLCAFFSWSLLRYYEKETGEKGADLGEVLMRSLFHDIEEAYSGDIPKPMKLHIGESVIAKLKEVQRLHLQKKVEGLGEELSKELIEVWANAKRGDLAGAIVALSDYLSLIHVLGREARLGNRILTMEEDSMRQYIQHLRLLHPQNVWGTVIDEANRWILRILKDLGADVHKEMIRLLEEDLAEHAKGGG